MFLSASLMSAGTSSSSGSSSGGSSGGDGAWRFAQKNEITIGRTIKTFI